MSGPERREQLIGVARELFAEQGYEATSIEEIAERAKVSKPVVYEHFGGKEGLYAVIVDREIAALTDRIKAALAPGHPRRTIVRRGWPGLRAALMRSVSAAISRSTTTA